MNMSLIHELKAAPGFEQGDLSFQCFLQAYPKIVSHLKPIDGGKRLLETKSGARFLWTDGDQESTGRRSYSQSLKETVRHRYPRLAPLSDTGPRTDPGRVRQYSWLKSLYGKDEKTVQAALEPVLWLPGVANTKLRFNGRRLWGNPKQSNFLPTRGQM